MFYYLVVPVINLHPALSQNRTVFLVYRRSRVGFLYCWMFWYKRERSPHISVMISLGSSSCSILIDYSSGLSRSWQLASSGKFCYTLLYALVHSTDICSSSNANGVRAFEVYKAMFTRHYSVGYVNCMNHVSGQTKDAAFLTHLKMMLSQRPTFPLFIMRCLN